MSYHFLACVRGKEEKRMGWVSWSNSLNSRTGLKLVFTLLQNRNVVALCTPKESTFLTKIVFFRRRLCHVIGFYFIYEMTC